MVHLTPLKSAFLQHVWGFRLLNASISVLLNNRKTTDNYFPGCMHVHTYVCVYIHTYTHAHALFIYLHVHKYTYTHVYIHMYVYLCMQMQTKCSNNLSLQAHNLPKLDKTFEEKKPQIFCLSISENLLWCENNRNNSLFSGFFFLFLLIMSFIKVALSDPIYKTWSLIVIAKSGLCKCRLQSPGLPYPTEGKVLLKQSRNICEKTSYFHWRRYQEWVSGRKQHF